MDTRYLLSQRELVTTNPLQDFLSKRILDSHSVEEVEGVVKKRTNDKTEEGEKIEESDIQNEIQEVMDRLENEGTRSDNRVDYDLEKGSRVVFYEQNLQRSDGEIVTYKFHDKAHFAYRLEAVVRLPSIEVRDEHKGKVRISYKEKTFLIMLEEVSTSQRDEAWGEKYNSITYDLLLECHGERLWAKSYEDLIADCQGQVEWSETKIDGQLITLPQHSFFSPENSVKLILLDDKNDIKFHYKYRRDIRHLIRYQLKNEKTGEWEFGDPKDFFTYCRTDIDQGAASVPIPDIICRYGRLNKDEVGTWMNMKQNLFYITQFQSFKYLDISDVIVGDRKNPKASMGIEVQVDGATRGIFWMMRKLEVFDEDDQALNFFENNFFAYSGEDGKDIVLSSTLKYDNDTVWRNMASFHHSRRQFAGAGLRTPRRIGYHYYPFSRNGILGLQSDSNMNLKDLKASLTLNYNVPAGLKVHPVVIFDMHNVIVYRGGQMTLYRDEAPPLLV